MADLLDILTSPHFFYRKCVGAAQDQISRIIKNRKEHIEKHRK